MSLAWESLHSQKKGSLTARNSRLESIAQRLSTFGNSVITPRINAAANTPIQVLDNEKPLPRFGRANKEACSNRSNSDFGDIIRRQSEISAPGPWQTSATTCPDIDTMMPCSREALTPSRCTTSTRATSDWDELPFTHSRSCPVDHMDADERVYSKSFQRWKRLELQGIVKALAKGSEKDFGLVTSAFEAGDPFSTGWVSASEFEAVLVQFGVAPDVAHRVPQIIQQGVTEVNQLKKGCVNYRSFMTQLDKLLRQGLGIELGIESSSIATPRSITPRSITPPRMPSITAGVTPPRRASFTTCITPSRRPSITPSGVGSRRPSITPSGVVELPGESNVEHLDADERVYSKSFQRWKRLELRDIAKTLSESSGHNYDMIVSAFEAEDSFNSGLISASAFSDVLVRFGVAPHTAHQVPQILQQTVAEVNQNNKGCVSYKNFMAQLDSVSQSKSQLEGLRGRWRDAAAKGVMQQSVIDAFRLTPRV